ncbi:MAG: GtrA family protein [Streptococcaceae bacterium]|jgi:putative flippase GtrA|nr:GtrA family protein [Streptococcaceae bacterium]
MPECTLTSHKEKTDELLMYFFFGFLATIVYFIVRLFIFSINENASFSETIAQIVSIIFAFITNKFWVFKNQNKEKGLWLQFFCFVVGRLFVLAICLVLAFFAIDKYHNFFIRLFYLNKIDYTNFLFSNPLTKNVIGTSLLLENFIFAILGQTVAIATNYIISKFIVFKN